MAMVGQNIPVEAVRRNIDSLGIKYNELPHLPFWAPFAGRSEQAFKQQIAGKIMMSSAFTGRELTQAEKDAISHHYAKYLVIQAWDTPFVFGSTYACYRGTYAKYGFPFWTPKADKFDPNKFPLVSKSLSKDTYQLLSQKSWHSLRFVAWFAACKFAIGIFVTSYSISTFVAGSNSDPRLKEYNQVVGAKVEQMRRTGGLKSAQSTDSGPPDTQEPTNPWANTEQNNQDSESAWSGTSDTSSPARPQDSFREDESYVFDDASPVAPAEQRRPAPQQNNQGSAWDRIRNQARPAGAVQSQGSAGQSSAWDRKREDERTSQGAREGSSFNFSSGDEEKSYAKEQAQKDFDEMLERERRGDAAGRR